MSSISLPSYITMGTWIRQLLGGRVQKIAVNAGFTCPNRDGSVGTGGCVFCNNEAFNPSYCDPHLSVREQVEDGKRFFAHKYPDARYLVYFQAFSNTYAPLPHLKRLYEEALSVNGVVGIVIGTRPDCIDAALLGYLSDLSKRAFVMIEYGVESCEDDILQRIHRGHTFACSQRAIQLTHEAGLYVGAHVILGLPGDSREIWLRQAEMLSELPIDVLKIHQLQIIKGTPLASDYAKAPFHLFTADEYVRTLADYIQHLRSDIVLERFVSESPSRLLVAPRWGLKPQVIVDRVNRLLAMKQ